MKPTFPAPLTRETPSKPLGTVFDLDARYKAWLAAIEDGDGELTPELEDELRDLIDDQINKLHNIAKLNKYADSMWNMARTEVERLQSVAAKYAKLAARAKFLAGVVLQTMPDFKAKAGTFSLWIQKNGQPTVIPPEDLSAIPSEWIKETVHRSLDTAKILAAWRANEPLPPGIHIELGTHVRIK